LCQSVVTSPNISNVEIFIEEGDSVDATYKELINWKNILPSRLPLYILKYNTGTTEKIASVRSKSRYKHLSHVGDVLLDYIVRQEKFDYVFWIEMDLIIKDFMLIENLLDGFTDSNIKNVGIVAPTVKCIGGGKTDIHYDVLCFKHTDGTNWTPHYNLPIQKYIEVSGVGSCCLFKHELLDKGVRFSDKCFMNFCHQARQLDYNMIVDSECSVWHPTRYNVDGRWL